MNIKKEAFTLVELIVVITILAILGTISFLSFQGYSTDSRNSVRYNDLKLIESSLELYSQKTGFYPESTLPVTITFANAEAWTQGTFGKNTFGSVGKLDHLPVDPLTGTEYTYSLLNTKGEYELGAALEGIVASNDNIINKTYAGTLEGTNLVLGTYNGNMLKVSTGGLDYVLALPTIISGDTNYTLVDEILYYRKLSYNGSQVIPGSYEGTEFDTNKIFGYGFDSATGGLIVFSGSLDDLKTDELKRAALLDNLQQAYTGSVLEIDVDYKEIINGNKYNLALSKNLIENSLDIKLPSVTLDNKSCKTLLYTGGSVGDGVYRIEPEDNGVGFDVYCDMTSDGGGWTKIVHINPLTKDHVSKNVFGNLLSGFGKLSDVNINLLNASIYKFETFSPGQLTRDYILYYDASQKNWNSTDYAITRYGTSSLNVNEFNAGFYYGDCNSTQKTGLSSCSRGLWAYNTHQQVYSEGDTRVGAYSSGYGKEGIIWAR